jgi:hypothetical protein
MDHGLVKDSMKTTYDKDPHVGIASHIPYSHRTAALFKPPFYLFSSVREPVSQFHSYYVEKCLASAYGRGKDGSAGNETLAKEIREMNEKKCADREDFSGREAKAMAMTKNPQLAYLRDADNGDEKLTVESLPTTTFSLSRKGCMSPWWPSPSFTIWISKTLFILPPKYGQGQENIQNPMGSLPRSMTLCAARQGRICNYGSMQTNCWMGTLLRSASIAVERPISSKWWNFLAAFKM